jgi:hypothetical protein
MLSRKLVFIAAASSALVLAGAALMARPAPPAHGDPTRLRTVCASHDTVLRGQAHRYLAMCTRSAQETTPNDPGHIDLYLLKRDAEGWRVVAQQLALESGHHGQPGEVRVLQLGAAFHGFELNETSVSHGYVLGGTRLHVPRGDTFRVALDFTSSVKNSGAHECAHATPAICSDFSRRLSVQPSGAAEAVYALQITSAGSFRGQPVSASHRLNYDPQQQQYRLPVGFVAQVE